MQIKRNNYKKNINWNELDIGVDSTLRGFRLSGQFTSGQQKLSFKTQAKTKKSNILYQYFLFIVHCSKVFFFFFFKSELKIKYWTTKEGKPKSMDKEIPLWLENKVFMRNSKTLQSEEIVFLCNQDTGNSLFTIK